jgi:2-polyprenyl-6-methoxyphenol hydroxylase-like FAD-dependent oxidoreductase
LNTELESFEQTDDRVLAKLVKKVDGKEVTETFEASYLIGADGGKGMFSLLILNILADYLYRFL